MSATPKRRPFPPFGQSTLHTVGFEYKAKFLKYRLKEEEEPFKQTGSALKFDTDCFQYPIASMRPRKNERTQKEKVNWPMPENARHAADSRSTSMTSPIPRFSFVTVRIVRVSGASCAHVMSRHKNGWRGDLQRTPIATGVPS